MPKSNFNNFGKFKYRSCEDVVEAVKEVLPEGYSVTLSDEVVMIGDRFYIKALAMLCGEAGFVQSFGYAREPAVKKGSDESQITGAASSYARKYALNGLFAIDDTKDADTNEHRDEKATKSGGIHGGVLDTEAREDAKIEFLKRVHAKLDAVSTTTDLKESLTVAEKDYLKNKLSVDDPIAYRAFRERYANIEATLTQMEN